MRTPRRAFAVSAPRARRIEVEMRASVEETLRSSASSWQDLIMGPGSPDAARVPGLRTRPAGAAPHPASRRLMRTPLKKDEVKEAYWRSERRG